MYLVCRCACPLAICIACSRPLPPRYELCDEHGLYVVDEANIETHGFATNCAISLLACDRRWRADGWAGRQRSGLEAVAMLQPGRAGWSHARGLPWVPPDAASGRRLDLPRSWQTCRWQPDLPSQLVLGWEAAPPLPHHIAMSARIFRRRIPPRCHAACHINCLWELARGAGRLAGPLPAVIQVAVGSRGGSAPAACIGGRSHVRPEVRTDGRSENRMPPASVSARGPVRKFSRSSLGPALWPRKWVSRTVRCSCAPFTACRVRFAGLRQTARQQQ